MTPRKEIIMKKIISVFFAMFIIFVMALPAFATTGCDEHVVNYPATPAYTHETGIDIYLCDVCGYEMWHCEECNQYMSIDEISCKNCEKVRAAINSKEQAAINTAEKEVDKSARNILFSILVGIVLGLGFLALRGNC